MNYQSETSGLWLRARYREKLYESEACLLVYDVDSFDDFLVGGDVKKVFERRASTANIFVVAPFVDNTVARSALATGVAVQRAISYMSPKSGSIYLVEVQADPGTRKISVTKSKLTWEPLNESVGFSEPEPLDDTLRDGWLFDLFDSNQGLVVAPPGVHFRKSSTKHTEKFLRAANTLTSSGACGLIAVFALAELEARQPRRILVDTAPLISVAYAMMRAAKARGIWQIDVPAKSFSSYGGQPEIGRLSVNDVVLISATTSGSLAKCIADGQSLPPPIVTLFFLGEADAARPSGVLCDLRVSGNRAFGYQPAENYPAVGCKLCAGEFILAELEGDQFLLQQRRHRLLNFVQTTQTREARATLTELSTSAAAKVVLRPDSTAPSTIEIDEKRLLGCPEIRTDFIRLLRRYVPQPIGLVVRESISETELIYLIRDAGLGQVIPPEVKIIELADIASQPKLAEDHGVLVVFGCLSKQTLARQINASLRAIVQGGNVAYLSALTLSPTPEQYQDLKTFLSYGERGADSFTFRDARRLALPDLGDGANPWVEEFELLNRLVNPTISEPEELTERRNTLSSVVVERNGIFLSGLRGQLEIQRDFVYLDTRGRVESIAQADVFSVVSNLFAVARTGDRELTKKASNSEIVELAKSVYGHVLLAPDSFMKFNDAVLKACLLRAARTSELMYEVDETHSIRMSEIVLAELDGWPAGNGDALPEMLMALATRRLRLREPEKAKIIDRALAAGLPPYLAALAQAIPV